MLLQKFENKPEGGEGEKTLLLRAPLVAIGAQKTHKNVFQHDILGGRPPIESNSCWREYGNQEKSLFENSLFFRIETS